MIKPNETTKPNANAVGAGPVSAQNSKGITLVALIITIIVMLILAGVSISIAINGGLFDITKRAVKETENAKNVEQALANGRVKIGETWYDSIEDYVNDNPSANQGEDGGETPPEETVKPQVGDYINYTPDTVSENYTLYGKYSGYGTYSSNVLETSTDQEIKQDKLNWQILKIYEDGSMDIIGSPTSEDIYFQGALGYNNGVYLMNDICDKLYSKKTAGIEARSVGLEDFEDEDLVVEGAKWKETRDAYTNNGIQYGHAKTYKAGASYYPNLYARENGSGIGVEIGSTDTEEQIKAKLKKDGIKDTDAYYTKPTEETYSPQETPSSDNSLTVTQTCYSMAIDETNYGETKRALYNSTTYWVASRCVLSTANDAIFRLRIANTYLGNSNILRSNRQPSCMGARLRPVVSLKSSIQLDTSDNATNANYPHEIIKY